MLRSIENRIESLVTGMFGRAFRSHVQPVELARKLIKEMDDHRAVSLSRVYVPNEYHVYLSPRDREQFVGYEEGLLLELGDFLSEHARREGYSVVSAPRVLLHEDDDLSLGEFGIATRMTSPPLSSPEPASGPPASEPPASGPAEPLQEPASPLPPDVSAPAPPVAPAPVVAAAAAASAVPPRPPQREEDGGTRAFPVVPEEPAAPDEQPGPQAVLVVSGRRIPVGPGPVTLGRSPGCDVTIDDPSVSRKHAEIRSQDGGWTIDDLGSTNGTFVNGNRVDNASLRTGDRIALGQSELRFEQP